MPPDDDLLQELHELHRLLVDGDPIAPARLAELLIPLLVYRLSKRYPNIADTHLVETAVHDAFLSYIEKPEQYNPSLLPLDSYLRMSADGDLRNLLNRSSHQTYPRQLGQIVELDALPAELQVEDRSGPTVEDEVLNRNASIWQHLATLVDDPVDYELVMLMMENERRTTEYAIVLGMSHLSPDDQAREVKRHKDRLKKQLQRHIRRSEIQDND